MAWVGKSAPRKEGLSKLTGQAKYLDDLQPKDCWHGVTVRSQCARGRIKGIHYREGVPWKEITIVTASDIPGKNAVMLLTDDQPFLAHGNVNHLEEPILLLAHPDKNLLEKARTLVDIIYEPANAIYTLEDSLAKKERIWGNDNTFKSITIDKGNVDSAWRKAEFIVEGEFYTGAQEQLYIEPNACMATANPQDGVTVWGSMQCPYYVHKALKSLFRLEDSKVRVIQTETGGGFGGKEEYPSLIAGHAALLAWKTGKTVKMVYDRAEDMAATTKRHPSRTRHKAAFDKDGKLIAMDIEFVLDGGAYMTLSPVVLSRGAIHAAGPYACPNTRVKARAVATNCPPHGAFRGFGAPQSIFALERQMDRAAKKIGISPEEIRRRNFVKKGDTLSTGQLIREEPDLAGILDLALEKSQYHRKRKAFEKLKDGKKRGMGIATFLHGAGFTGSGETYLASIVGAEVKDGKVYILSSNTEIGQGTNTIFGQIAADALGLEYDDIVVENPDTAKVPNSGPTVASRTCMIVGKLVEDAVTQIKKKLVDQKLLGEKYSRSEFFKACQAYSKKNGVLKGTAQYQQPPHVKWDDQTYQGEAYGAFAWAAYVSEVEIDPVTYQTEVKQFVAVQEVGKVVNPTLAEGQIVGGVAQAIGFALTEEVVWEKGRMKNASLTNYIVPTAVDTPPIEVYFKESPYAFGPQGAKGIGELPMDGPAPAILNAVDDALCAEFNEIPLTPEKLMVRMT